MPGSLSVVGTPNLNYAVGASVTIVPSTAFVANNSAILLVQEKNSTSIGLGSVSDTAGNEWVADGQYYAGTEYLSAISSFHCNGILAGSPTITFTAAQTDSGDIFIVIVQASGGPIALDDYATIATGTAETVSTNTITPSQAGDLLFAMGSMLDSSASDPTNGFTAIDTADSAYTPFAYLADSGDTAISTSWTRAGTGAWAAGIIAYESSGSSSSTTQGLLMMLA